MGKKLLRIYTTPPYAYWPPGYPIRESTRTYCKNFVQRGLQVAGRPDWQSRSGGLLAAEVCGRGYDQLVQRGWLPPGRPRLIPERRRGQWIDLDTGRVGDYPVPEEPWPFPGPRQPGKGPQLSQGSVPSPRQSFTPFLPQGPTPYERQQRGTVAQGSQSPPVQPQVPGQGQPTIVADPGQGGYSPFGQTPYPSPRGQPWLPSFEQGSGGGTGQVPSRPDGQTPFAPGPRQTPSAPPAPGVPPVVPTLDLPTPLGDVPLGKRPKVKPGGTDILPTLNVPVGVNTGGDGGTTIYYDAIARVVNFVASFFGQTAIKAQKVGIQDWFTPIFRWYSEERGLPLRDKHFLQFDPEGVQKYTLSDPLYNRLRNDFLREVGPLSRFFSKNPGPGLTERIVNQFVTNAAINKWTEDQTRVLWRGVLDSLPER